MTPDPTLTDEELAEMDDRRARSIGYLYFTGQPRQVVEEDVPRLIAALRASRAEVEELKAQLHKATVLGAGWD